MGRNEYLESMGIRAARCAFFSYTMEPQGSYSIYRILARFLQDNHIEVTDENKEKVLFFLSDYVLLRIYVAKYILAGYAGEYTPLLHLFDGFKKVEQDFAFFMEEESVPGRSVEAQFLPPHFKEVYNERKLQESLEFFDGIAKRYEEREPDLDKRLKCIVDECLSRISIRNDVSVSTRTFWFLSTEMGGYEAYLKKLYAGLIPPSFYGNMKIPASVEEREEKEEADGAGFNYGKAAYVVFALIVAICILLAINDV